MYCTFFYLKGVMVKKLGVPLCRLFNCIGWHIFRGWGFERVAMCLKWWGSGLIQWQNLVEVGFRWLTKPPLRCYVISQRSIFSSISLSASELRYFIKGRQKLFKSHKSIVFIRAEKKKRKIKNLENHCKWAENIDDIHVCCERMYLCQNRNHFLLMYVHSK